MINLSQFVSQYCCIIGSMLTLPLRTASLLIKMVSSRRKLYVNLRNKFIIMSWALRIMYCCIPGNLLQPNTC